MIMINGKSFSGKFTEEKYKKIVIEIMKLPQPKVYSMDEVKIKPESSVIIAQREACYIDQLATLDSPQYIGSKHFGGCILVYLHTETDHAIVHVDKFVKPDFLAVIKQFNDQETIYVSIAAGIAGESEQALKNITEALLIASEKIRIVINKQKIMENNQELDVYQQVFDLLKLKGDLVYRYLFNEAMDINFLADKKINDFYNDKNAKSTNLINPELIKLISVICAISMDPSKRTITCPVVLKFNKNHFLKLLDSAFSQQGFLYCDLALSKFNLYGNSTLRNFVIDTNTGNIHIIGKDFYTPNEAGRILSLLDKRKCRYFFVYTNKHGDYAKPDYSNEFTEHLNGLKKKMLLPNFKEDLFQLYEVMKNPLSPYYLEIYLNESQKTSGDNKLVHSYKKYLLANSHENIPELTNNIRQHLCVLDKLSGKKFEAKLRKNPAYTIDAFLLCDSNMECEEIHAKVMAQKIHALMIEDKGNFYVCVPAINIKKYSDQIVDVNNKLFKDAKIQNNIKLFVTIYANDSEPSFNKPVINPGMR